MPKKQDQEPEVKKYLLLSGSHVENDRDDDGKLLTSKTYEAGEIVESKRDLISVFGANRFRLVSDDVQEMKTGPALGEGEDAEEFTRLNMEEKVKAGKDGVNKVTEEEAKKFKPGTQSPAFAYREDHGFEQDPPEEELHDDQDERKKDLDLPAKRTSAERTSAKTTKPKEDKPE